MDPQSMSFFQTILLFPLDPRILEGGLFPSHILFLEMQHLVYSFVPLGVHH